MRSAITVLTFGLVLSLWPAVKARAPLRLKRRRRFDDSEGAILRARHASLRRQVLPRTCGRPV